MEAPDGSTQPMTEEDLLMVRRFRPDMDDRLPIIEVVEETQVQQSE